MHSDAEPAFIIGGPLGELPEEEEAVFEIGRGAFVAEAQAGHALGGESTGR